MVIMIANLELFMENLLIPHVKSEKASIKRLDWILEMLYCEGSKALEQVAQ